MEHQHKYDANGKQLCCTQEEKINSKTDKKSGCCCTEPEQHSDDDGHDHEHSEADQSVFQMFLPAIISFILLLIAIGFDNYFEQTWFTGWIRIGWYILR